MYLFVLGIDHRSAPVEVRERVAFRPSQYGQALGALVGELGLAEAALLSTCNRVEVYAVAADLEAAQAVGEWLHAFHGLAPGTLDEQLVLHANAAAVEHLFAVTSGVNSLVVGESQIQRQVREAASLAGAHHSLGPVLNTLFRRALEVGKRARTETMIDRHAASVSQAGVELARRVFGGLDTANVLLVGSGKVSELAAKNLLDNGARAITLVNRTLEHACQLAQSWGGHALPFEDLQPALNGADIVITSTSAPHTVVHLYHVQLALAGREGRPLILIDLAVPRDVDDEVSALPGVHLYNVDDLQSVAADNMRRRSAEIEAVRAIIEAEAAEFLRWLGARAVVPTLTGLRAHAERIRQDEVAKALRRIGPLGERERSIVEALSLGIVNKLLHQPTVRLKQQSENGSGVEFASALRELFGLEQGNA